MIELEFMGNHNHTEISNFRLKDCIIKVPDLINRAIELDYAGVSITDHEALSGHIQFMQRYQELKKLRKKYVELKNLGKEEEIAKDKALQKNLKYIEKDTLDNFKIGLGNEIYLVDSLEEVKDNYTPGVTKFWHFILIAKDEKGYEQIKRISSESAWKNWFKQGKMERVPTIKSEMEEIIGEDKGHIIAQTGCLGGEFPNLVLKYFKHNGGKKDKRKIHEFIMWGKRLFGEENFFLELQPTLETPKDTIEETHDQIVFNQKAVMLAKAYGIGYVFSCDCHYLKKEHRMIHEAYLKSDEDNNSNREVGEFYATTYMMDKDELYDFLSTHLTHDEIIEGFKNTIKIHDMIEDYDLSHDVIVPKDNTIPNVTVRHTFKNWYGRCEYIKKFSESDDPQEKYFLYLLEESVLNGKLPMTDEVVYRFDTEMGEIWNISEKLGMRLASYYILVLRIIHEVMWKVSYVGIARGSITGYLTAYAIGITQMNPLKYNLPHWRHLSAERPELPDVDVDSEAAKRPLIFDGMKEYFGENNVLNTLTLKTEGSKSCAQTCAKGMGLCNDTAQHISDLIPFERGSNWTLTDCFEGNEEKGRKPVKEFINEVAKYEGLKEVMLLIEGLVCGRSIHASAVYIFENGYLEHNSKMRAPNGTYITAYNMHDSDWCGALKFDCLTIAALDKIHKCVDLLVEKGVLEDQGSIKSTYDKYIHPDVLDYNDDKMWVLLGENKIVDAFQFDTEMGVATVKQTKPHSLVELATANSLMRLMAGEGEEPPAETYTKYKNDISLWYKEMRDYGLTEEEIKILEPHLLPVYGVAETQEVVMRLSMDKKISGFNIADSNMLRKAIAKKKADVLDKAKELFFSKGKQCGASETLLNYVWYVQFKKSFGYSFSQNHCHPYAGICLQEMNLACKYPMIFWNTACLCINAGADENNANNKNTDYGKIAKAIGNMKLAGQEVSLPDINKAGFGFEPDVKGNKIVFGLMGISGVGDNEARMIVANQPYTSFDDFTNRCPVGITTTINLIKAGCFNELEQSTPTDVLKYYINKISKPLIKLSLSQITTLNDLGLLTPEQKQYELRLYHFREYIFKKKFLVRQDGKSANTQWYRLEKNHAEPFFYEFFETNMIEGKDYEYSSEGDILVKRGSIDREYKRMMKNFEQNVLSNIDMIAAVNKVRFNEVWNEKASGTEAKWYMSTLSYYPEEHELSHINMDEYSITSFKDLPEEPEVVEYRMYRGKEVPRFKLSRICGTVLDKDKNKNTITLLTPDSGVVMCKLNRGTFSRYNSQLSIINPDTGKKTVLEKSWMNRGNLLLIHGYRKNDKFLCKHYVDSVYRHSLALIEEVKEDNKLKIKLERSSTEDE